MREQLTMFEMEPTIQRPDKVVNVASVPQRSPFRYPGGKTWLVPIVRKWLSQGNQQADCLIEPFAGGGIISLTAAFESLASSIIMVEKDEEVAAVWEVILNGKNEWLANKIYNFELTHKNIISEFENPKKQIQDIAFCTILKNRVCHGGIIAKGSGFLKKGENGKGILSRWYPKTLRDRILAINHIKHKIQFLKGDAFEILEKNCNQSASFFFIDPPYTIAAKRLYTYFDVDHEKLFYISSKLKGHFLLTYDDTIEIRKLADKFNLKYKTTLMKTTHHLEKHELLISDNFEWHTPRQRQTT